MHGVFVPVGHAVGTICGCNLEIKKLFKNPCCATRFSPLTSILDMADHTNGFLSHPHSETILIKVYFHVSIFSSPGEVEGRHI